MRGHPGSIRLRSLFVATVAAALVVSSGCVSRRYYPDQKVVFLDNAQNAARYTLHETSSRQLEDEEERVYDAQMGILRRLQDEFAADTNVVQYVERIRERLTRWHDKILSGQQGFSRTLAENDRVFLYSYNDELVSEEGLLVLRNGKVILKSPVSERRTTESDKGE